MQIVGIKWFPDQGTEQIWEDEIPKVYLMSKVVSAIQLSSSGFATITGLIGA